MCIMTNIISLFLFMPLFETILQVANCLQYLFLLILLFAELSVSQHILQRLVIDYLLQQVGFSPKAELHILTVLAFKYLQPTKTIHFAVFRLTDYRIFTQQINLHIFLSFSKCLFLTPNHFALSIIIYQHLFFGVNLHKVLVLAQIERLCYYLLTDQLFEIVKQRSAIIYWQYSLLLICHFEESHPLLQSLYFQLNSFEELMVAKLRICLNVELIENNLVRNRFGQPTHNMLLDTLHKRLIH